MRYTIVLLPCVLGFALAKPLALEHQSRPLNSHGEKIILKMDASRSKRQAKDPHSVSAMGPRTLGILPHIYLHGVAHMDNSRFKRSLNGVGFTGHLDHPQTHHHGLDDMGHLDHPLIDLHGVEDTDILSRRFKRSEEDGSPPEKGYRAAKKPKKKGQTNKIEIKDSSWKGDQNVEGQDEQSNQIAVAGSKWMGSQNIKAGPGGSDGSSDGSSEEDDIPSEEEVQDQSARYQTFIEQYKTYSEDKAKKNKKLDKRRALNQMKDFLDWALTIDTGMDLNNYSASDGEELGEAHTQWRKIIKSRGKFDKKYQILIKDFLLEIESGSIKANEGDISTDYGSGSSEESP